MDFKYPYTDFHELNLDWFLEKFKEYYEHITEQDQKITTMEETVEQFTTFVTNYFDNLDVQQEINNKLDEMAANGQLQALLQPYFDSFVAGVNEQINTQNRSINNLQAQINEIVAPDPDPTLAEVAAARVGYDGTVYPTLKARCDADVERVVNFKDSDIFIQSKNIFDQSKRTDGYFINDVTGVETADITMCHSDYMPVEASTIYCVAPRTAASVTFYNSSKVFLSGANITPVTLDYGTFTTPANAAFAIVSMRISNATVTQIEKNSTPTDYISYGGVVLNTSEIPDGGIPQSKVAGIGNITNQIETNRQNIGIGNAYQGTLNANASSASFDTVVNFTANTPYYFELNDDRLKNATVYLFRSDNTYVTVANLIFNYGYFVYTPTEDFVKVRFYIQPVEVSENARTINYWFGQYYPDSLKAAIENDEKILNGKADLFYYGFSAFHAFGVCGDSLSVGYYTDNGGTSHSYDAYYNWGQYMAREHGIKCANFGKAGVNPKTWLSDADCWAKLNQADNKCQAYIIGLGYNAMATLGTIADIDLVDYTQNADTFYGQYGRVIQQIHEFAPSAQIFCLTIPYPKAQYNENVAIRAITGIADFEDYVTLVDLALNYNYLFDDDRTKGYIYEGHSTPAGYALLSNLLYACISDTMHKTPLKYNGIPQIPYGSNLN